MTHTHRTLIPDDGEYYVVLAEHQVADGAVGFLERRCAVSDETPNVRIHVGSDAGSVAMRKFDKIGTLPVVAQRRRKTTDSVQLRDEILIATEPRRAGRLFVQYDGGALVPKWFEAPVSEAEAESLKTDEQTAHNVLLQRQARSSPLTPDL